MASAIGLRHPASASCLGRHLRLAGRCPNNSSLFPPLAAVVVVALWPYSAELLFKISRLERPRLRSNESPSGAFKRQSGLRKQMEGLCPDKLCGALQTHFHRWGRGGKRQVPRRFLRKRSAAGDYPLSLLTAFAASSPEGGAFGHLPVSRAKPPPFGGGGTAQAVTERVRAPLGELARSD